MSLENPQKIGVSSATASQLSVDKVTPSDLESGIASKPSTSGKSADIGAKLKKFG